MERRRVGFDAARGFLDERFGRRRVDIFEELLGGMWSVAYGFTVDGRELVVRFGHHRDDYERDAFAASLREPRLAVPETIEVGAAFDGCYSITTRAHGEPLELLNEAAFGKVVPALLDVFGALCDADLSATTGYGNWNAQGNAVHASARDAILDVLQRRPGERLDGWRAALEVFADITRLFDRAGARLGEIADCVPAERHAVHSDLINRNVLVDDDRISAVFDWGCAMTGDAVYDVAWLEFWSPWHAGFEAADVLGAFRRRAHERQTLLVDLEARLEVAYLHIALSNMAYCAWSGRSDDLRNTADRLVVMAQL